MGSAFVHGTYPTLTAAQLGTAITLPTTGPTTTTCYMNPTPNLPLLDPVGNTDHRQPNRRPGPTRFRVLVDLSYGSTTQGWSTGPANVPTPFGVIPPVGPITVANALAAGTPQGFSAFMNDVSAEARAPSNLSLPSLTSIGSAGMGCRRCCCSPTRRPK